MDDRSFSKLTLAAKRGQYPVVRELITPSLINEHDERGYVALRYAVCENHMDIVKLLLENGALPDERDKRRRNRYHPETPFQAAILYNRLEMMVIFLATGTVDVNKRYLGKMTALHYACEYGFLEMVKLLMNHGSNVNVSNAKSCTAIDLACNNNDGEMVEYLFNKGAIPNEKTLEFAISRRRIGMMKSMLYQIPSLVHIMATTWPLCLAAKCGKIAMVALLLKQGANINCQDPVSGSTSVIIAATYAEKRIVKLFISFGADIMIRDYYGRMLIDVYPKQWYVDAIYLGLQMLQKDTNGFENIPLLYRRNSRIQREYYWLRRRSFLAFREGLEEHDTHYLLEDETTFRDIAGYL
jgi:ankyrin repeat protein